MNIEGLEFEEVQHRYTFKGQRVQSVTQILENVRLVDTKWFTEWARDRGSAVHLATELDDQGVLDYEDLDDRIKGYIDAYRKFKRECEWDATDSEMMVYHRTMGYAGTLDRAGWLNRCQRGIIDIKTGALTRAVGLQLTGYADAYQDVTGHYVGKIIGLQLNEDGSYKMRPYPLDFSVWRAAVMVSQWIDEA